LQTLTRKNTVGYIQLYNNETKAMIAKSFM
jgi:hypothetical protein